MKSNVSRRRFMQTTASAAFVGGVVNFAWAQEQKPADSKSPGEAVNVGVVGANGQARANIERVSKAGANVVALCDVDGTRLAEGAKGFEKARQYTDWRKMLEQKDIDAVIVACPDHMHAFATIAAMQLGKHVYCEKPLTHSIWEARRVAEVAKKMNVRTQMGHNGNATEGTRLTVEMIRAGVIGDIKEIHTWTNRPIWPQGIERPKAEPVPANLNWDLWLGPAPERPYNHIYHPFNWRGWVDFGTGALGDMGCHIINASYWALNLGYPDWVEAGCWFNGETWPEWSIIRYQFPARDDRPAVKMFWYDGGKLPERPKELEADRQFATGGGTLWIGEKGKMITATSQAPRLIPESKMKDFVKPPQTIERLPVGPSPHHREWLDAIKSGKESSANFQYSAMLTEIVLLGNVAIRARKKIEWDGPNMKVKGMPEADQFIKREYRKGWSL
ncbi:MAG TPA: Gfo/Idh/MocA family oxidoreductase [Tepidisphaeraceae bacterium]|nr:Gfo/Idh/MocA family oxidoreductase [Tepidisphaeraceae bacterium]